jgi:hypothetical protein
MTIMAKRKEQFPTSPAALISECRYLWRSMILPAARAGELKAAEAQKCEAAVAIFAIYRREHDALSRDPLDLKRSRAVTRWQKLFFSLSRDLGLTPLDRAVRLRREKRNRQKRRRTSRRVSR